MQLPVTQSKRQNWIPLSTNVRMPKTFNIQRGDALKNYTVFVPVLFVLQDPYQTLIPFKLFHIDSSATVL